MSHNVTSMFSVREVPWHGLGKIIQDAVTSESAIKEAGLDWEVTQIPLYYMHNQKLNEAENYVANVRSDTGTALGVVTSKYRVVQNSEAFAFTDMLLGYDVYYETAGALNGGKMVWLLAKMPSIYMVGDVVDPYLVFTNAHDGKSAIRAAITPIRVVCNNTLNLALSKASRSWSIRHMGDIKSKIHEAQNTLGLANQYMLNLGKTADDLVSQKINKAYVDKTVEFLFPIDDDDTKRRKQNQEEAREDIVWRLENAPDIANFRDTKWGLINAITDSSAHKTPARVTDSAVANAFINIIAGPSLVDKAYEYIQVR